MDLIRITFRYFIATGVITETRYTAAMEREHNSLVGQQRKVPKGSLQSVRFPADRLNLVQIGYDNSIIAGQIWSDGGFDNASALIRTKVREFLVEESRRYLKAAQALL